MRRLIAAALLAAAIPLASTSVASADPNHGEELRCSGPTWVAPDINVKTCTYYFWWNYGANKSYSARVTVRNTSTLHPVYVTPELQVEGAVYAGSVRTINPGTEYEVWGDALQNLPWHERKTGRAYIQERHFATRTFAPSFP